VHKKQLTKVNLAYIEESDEMLYDLLQQQTLSWIQHIVARCAPAAATVQDLGVNLLLTPTCHVSSCPWQVINAIVRRCGFYWPTPSQLQLQSSQSLVLSFFSTGCTGAPFLVTCLLATELKTELYLVRNSTRIELSLAWYSLGADHIENTASNCASIVTWGRLPSNISSIVACLWSCCLAMNLWIGWLLR
jgi:hypothetical protein